jgi:integrase
MSLSSAADCESAMPRKPPKLEHVKYVRSRGHLYAYFNTGQKKNGKPIYNRLPDPGAIGFHDSYAAMVGGRTKRQKVGYTVADMVRDYERSAKFASHAVNTQKLYATTFRQIVKLLGDAEVNQVQRSDIQIILDNALAGPGARKIFLILVAVLYKWGRDNGKATEDPTAGIDRAKGGSHEPWPETAIEEALKSEDDVIRLVVHLLYFTGQRIGDVCKMRWSDIKDGVMHVVQQKTGKELWIPLLSELTAELSRTPKRGLTILAWPEGGAYSPEYIRKKIVAFTAKQGARRVPHGLRKNAVEAFLGAGCSVAETGAMTGQSYRIVEYYARRIDQRTMAKAAVFKLENKRGSGKQGGKHAK